MPALRAERWDEAIALIEDGARSSSPAPGGALQPRLRRVARRTAAGGAQHLQEAVRADPRIWRGRRPTRTSTRSAASRAFRPDRGYRARAAQRSPGRRTPAASARNAGTGSLSGRATSRTAPYPVLRRQRVDEKLQADGERERLVGLRAAERRELLLGRPAGEHVAVGEVPHRDVRDDRPARRGGNRDRERVRPGQLRAAGRDGRAGGARWRSARRPARPRRAAAPSSRASRSGTSARRRRPSPRAAARRAAPRRSRSATR